MGGKNKQNHGVLVGYDLTTYQRQWIQYHGSRREPSDIINCQGIPSNSENNVCIMFNSSVEVYAYNSEEIQFITQLQRQILPLSVYKKSQPYIYLLRKSEVERINLLNMEINQFSHFCNSSNNFTNVVDISLSYLAYRTECNAVEIVSHGNLDKTASFSPDDTQILEIEISHDEQFVFLLLDDGRLLQIDQEGHLVSTIQLDTARREFANNSNLISDEYGLTVHIQDTLLHLRSEVSQ